jgi:hypothetical protein
VNQNKRFFGKYRGKITNNKDPSNQARILALVPAVFGGDRETAWALPSVPYAGNGVGFVFIPPIGTNVWIEFENGDPDTPIWSGCFWESGQAPIVPDIPDRKVIKTNTATISINDLSGVEGEGIRIETITGLKLIMNSQGIELNNGSSSIRLTPTNVLINNHVLVV